MAQNIRLELTYPEFVELYGFCLENKDIPELSKLLKKLDDKMLAMKKHDAYAKSKDTRLSPEEREKARQEYAELAEIPQSFRY